MQVEQSIREANLSSALSQAQREVRSDPKEPKHRLLLFQLLALTGQWDAATNELKALAQLSPASIATVQTYLTTLEYEAQRGEVFAGKKSPVVLGKPQPWVGSLVEALRLVAKKRFEEAKGLREQAFEGAPAIAGTLNGEPFEWVADADSRLGPVLEVILNRGYYWVPFARIRKLVVDKPTDLRDLAWVPVTITFTNGGNAVAFVPTRYPGSEFSPNNKIRLARLTEWTERPGETFLGSGQRILTTDKGEYPLLDVRELTLESPDEPDEVVSSEAEADTAGEAPADSTK